MDRKKNWKKEGEIKKRETGRLYFVSGREVFSAPLKRSGKGKKGKNGKRIVKR
jgi:hypothetical protein